MIDESGRLEGGHVPGRPEGELAIRGWGGAGMALYEPTFDDSPSPGLSPQYYLQVILKHWLVVVAAILVALAGGIALTLLTKPVYTAAVTLQIDKEAAKVVGSEDEVGPREQGSYEEFFQTQYGLLKSRSLAARTVDQAGLATDPAVLKEYGFSPSAAGSASVRKQLTDIVQRSVEVTPVQRSRLVSVGFSAPDPNIAARVANSLAENFIQSNLDRRFESSAYARQFLEQRLAQTRAKLEETERQLVAYAQNQEIIDLPVGDESGGPSGQTQSLTASNLQALNAALASAKANRIKAEQRWQSARANTSGAGLPDVLNNPTVQTLTAERAALESEYQQKLEVYKPDYPEMQQMRVRIEGLNRQIASEVANIRNSLRTQYEVAAAEEAAFNSQVNGLKHSVLDLRGRSIQYDILQREVDTNRSLYDGLLQRYKEVGVIGGLSTNNVSIVDQAQVPGHPSKPEPVKNMLAALLLGLVAGVGLAFLLEMFDESINAPQDVEAKLGLPLLGAIPRLERGVTPIEALDDIRSAFAEAYYSVQTALQFSTEHGLPRTMLISSARPSEGKSTSATAIARYLARLGSRVLLVDGDLRNPSLHRLMQSAGGAGLSNYLSSGGTLTELIQATETPNLSFMPSGPVPPSPAELIAGPRVTELLREARELFDIVVIDGPPVMGLADAPLLASRVEGTVMVVEAGGTGRNVVRTAVRRLRVGRARLLGVILTKFESRRTSYGYGYGYGYGKEFDYGMQPAIESK
ncbi:MAG TPA: polysaccharide biosynthesis tyrosine autokinase [Caulobacteraceae bacterium]